MTTVGIHFVSRSERVCTLYIRGATRWRQPAYTFTTAEFGGSKGGCNAPVPQGWWWFLGVKDADPKFSWWHKIIHYENVLCRKHFTVK